MVVSCAGTSSLRDNEAVFGNVEGKVWLLSELRSGASVITDRSKLNASGMGEIYTLSFKDGRVSGMGAPNRFFGPYTSSENRALKIGDVASTLMAALKEPDGLKENEYFRLLSKVTRWDIKDGKLQLYSSNSSGAEAILVFTSK